MINKENLKKYLNSMFEMECRNLGIEYTADHILSISEERKMQIARDVMNIQFGK
jgi:hypothetical protein